MLKTIKVKPEVYDALAQVQEKHESFSDCIARLLRVYGQVLNIGKPKQEEPSARANLDRRPLPNDGFLRQ